MNGFKPSVLADTVQVPATITVDTTYILKPVVGDRLYELKSDIRNNKRQRLFEFETLYEITAGQDVATVVSGNKLQINKAGNFTLKASVVGFEEVFQVVQCEAEEVEFLNISLVNDFSKITVYTQPIQLIGSIQVKDSILVEDYLQKLVFEVVSDPAEIYSENYLRFTGAGQVVLKVSSYHDSSVNKLFNINVTDPDAGLVTSDETFKQGDLTATPFPLWAIFTVAGAVAISAAATVLVLKKKVKKG